MLFLLDANTLIDAKRDYYGIEQVPEFWEWLVHQGNLGQVKVPVEVWDEFADKKDKNGVKDELATWADYKEVKDALLLNEEAEQILVDHIITKGYVAHPTDDQLVKIGRDPFLISYAFQDVENRCVVTTEVSAPKAQKANRKIPDVCKDFDIRCINSFQFFRELNFRTNWKDI